MYSESDLDAAVAAGALSPQAADALRNHVSARRTTPAVDEEHFRLLTGFHDLFVAIAAVLLLHAVSWLGHSLRMGGDWTRSEDRRVGKAGGREWSIRRAPYK